MGKSGLPELFLALHEMNYQHKARNSSPPEKMSFPQDIYTGAPKHSGNQFALII